MRATLLATLLLTAVAARGNAQAVSADPWLRAGTITVSVEFGGAAFSDFQRGVAHPVAGSGSGPVPRFERRISAGTAATVGGAASYWITNGVALRAGASYTPSHFRVWTDEQGERALQDGGSGATPAPAGLGVWLSSATVVFRLPIHLGRVVPYGIAGVGAVHYRVVDSAELPPEARSRFVHGGWTGAAAVFGLGTTLPLQRNNLLMNFELTNHLARTPLDGEGAGEWFAVNGVPLQMAPATHHNDDAIALTSNLRLTMGLTLPLRVRQP